MRVTLPHGGIVCQNKHGIFELILNPDLDAWITKFSIKRSAIGILDPMGLSCDLTIVLQNMYEIYSKTILTLYSPMLTLDILDREVMWMFTFKEVKEVRLSLMRPRGASCLPC